MATTEGDVTLHLSQDEVDLILSLFYECYENDRRYGGEVMRLIQKMKKQLELNDGND